MANATNDCQTRLEPARHDALHEELDAWRENVGAPIAIDAGPVAPARLAGIDVLSWNVAIGQGRLEAVLDRLRSGADGIGADPARPLIVLAQEAYREGDTVPGAPASLHHGGRLRERTRTSVVELAEKNGLSLRYSPSMRNGLHASDRGNAILATVRLADAHAFLLPYVRQRRVTVTSRLAGHPELTFVSAHLDTHGVSRDQPRGSRSIGAGRAAQAEALARALPEEQSVIVGADLNSVFGITDPAVRALVAAGFHPARRAGQWRHTFHRRLRLLLDHVLYRSPDDRIRSVTVTRLDEVEGDRSPAVFGSDHHPLLARIELNGS
ncbi:MAG TPA: endonuclease/exonuclease/phosphatase family protein [Longimicrobiales bacterium]